jgi:hypothetical protein
VEDQHGVNDVPGQVDLTQMGRDDSDPNTYKLFWSWDSIDQWTGSGQTGDACALFDTDSPGDGNVDFAVCARINNLNANPNDVRIVPAAAGKPVYLFTCGDKRNDRCSTPSPVNYNAGEVLAGEIGTLSTNISLITATDPFPGGTSYNLDSTVEVDIPKSKIPGDEALVNVCSYPSAGNGGNNNPFDCVVTPGAGFLKIVKNAGADATTNFTFTVNPAPEPPNPATQTITGTNQTKALPALIGSNYSVTEAVPAGWVLTSASCTIEGLNVSTGTYNSGANNVTGIRVASGRVTTCTFNDVSFAKLTVQKIVINDNGGTNVVSDFPLFVNGQQVTSGVQNTLMPGSYTVSETSLAGYTAVIGGDCASNGTITLGYGDVRTCTITNNDQAATLIVKKIVVNNNGGTKVASNFSFSVNSGSPVSFEADAQNNLTVNEGTYTVAESTVSGYTASYSNCTNVFVAKGGSATCTITNDDQKTVTDGNTVQRWVLHDTFTLTDFRPGASDAGSATVTFRLYGDAACTSPVGAAETVGLNVSTHTASTSSGVTVANSGSYYWRVTYSGDSYNEGYTTTCGEEVTRIQAKDDTHSDF